MVALFPASLAITDPGRIRSGRPGIAIPGFIKNPTRLRMVSRTVLRDAHWYRAIY